MTKPIYIAGGSKGGVGKSFVSIGLLDTLRERGENVLLIESDTSNPDVWKMYQSEVKSELMDLDDADGWIDLVNVCEQHPQHCVVINTAARNNRGVTAYGQTLNNTMDELQRKLVTFWVIDRQRDSLELLHDYMKTLSASTVHVVRNGYFGDEKKFELYNTSETRKLVEAAQGLSLTFPDLADRVSDDLYSKRLSVTAALGHLPMGNRAELRRWQGDVHAVLGAALDA
jgi:hypothetical protein